MESATIVKLGGGVSAVGLGDASTFEEAFGEQTSNLFGKKARARRKERKLEKIKNRDEVRTARQQSRIGRRSARKASRQQVRADQLAARQNRRASRVEAKQMRKDTRASREMDREAEAMRRQQELDAMYPEPIEQGYDEGGTAPEQGYPEEQGGYETQGYPEDQYYQEEEGGYDEGGYYDEGGGDEGYYEEEDYGDESYWFAGETEADNDTEFTDITVTPTIADLASKYEWNKELVKRLKAEKTAEPEVINGRINRIKEIKSNLDAYCNCSGDQSSADGGIDLNKKMARRRREVGAAIINARKRRPGRMKKNPMASLTQVEQGLNPSFGEQKIVVPPQSKSAADAQPTGLIGVDNINDADGEVREVKIGFSGATTKIPWKQIAIGFGIGTIAIISIRYFLKRKK